ncbi:MAG: MOSC domain-containing protein [Bacteroidia bacterium]|nr:MOSC domain-containing protein [Bacteroidia bacterium]
MPAFQLTELWVYPVKSLGGIRLKKSALLPKGLQYDRRWMLTDINGRFLTQREHHRLALFKTSFSADGQALIITFENDNITIPLQPPTDGQLLHTVQIWDDYVQALEVGDSFSRWFSQRLQSDAKLVYFPEPELRPVDNEYQVNRDHVSLADAFPYLVIGQSSLDDLNSRLDQKLPMNRFRPNFVVAGSQPFEEDTWLTVQIGSCKFAAVKTCSRCIIPTINQDTAERNAEPLKTLTTFRNFNHKIKFGMNLILLSGTEVHEGDAVVVEQTRPVAQHLTPEPQS